MNISITFERRVPVVLQAEAVECGLASLAMVAAYHGLHQDLSSLRARLAPSMRGVSLAQLMQMAASLDLAPRALRLELGALPQLRVPCILHWNMDHFVVLERVRGNQVWLIDPAVGRRRMTVAEFSSHFTGVALELTPTESFKPASEKANLTFASLFAGVSGLPKTLLKVLALSVAIQFLALLAPFFGQIVIDEIISSRDVNLLGVLVIAFALVGLLNVVVSAARTIFVLQLGATLQFGWAAKLFHHLIRLPLSFFERRSVGDVLSRFRSLSAVQNLVANTIVEAVVDGLMALTTIAVMLAYSPTLAAVPVAALFLYVILRASLYHLQREKANEALISGARENGHFLETLRGILSIKCFSGEHARESTWQNRSADAIRTNLTTMALGSTWQLVNQALLVVEGVVVLWLGAKLIIDGQFSVGMLMAFIAYKTQFTTRGVALIDKLLEFRLASVHLDRISDIALSERDPATEVATRDAPIAGGIELCDVCFRYSSSDPWIVLGINLKIRPGECVAIAGRSGAGKTTLLKLMLGLLTPERGQILVDDVALDAGRTGHWRHQVAAVMQEDTLLSGTIADNIAFFDQQPDLGKIERCARLAEIHCDVARLPMGLNTLVGDMGSTLSGGQKQRLLLARALYRGPKVLFLDEATSHLDPETERRIHGALQELKITRVVIAHRQETLKIADRVVTWEELQTVSQPDYGQPIAA